MEYERVPLFDGFLQTAIATTKAATTVTTNQVKHTNIGVGIGTK